MKKTLIIISATLFMASCGSTESKAIEGKSSLNIENIIDKEEIKNQEVIDKPIVIDSIETEILEKEESNVIKQNEEHSDVKEVIKKKDLTRDNVSEGNDKDPEIKEPIKNTISHSTFDLLLKKHVNADGKVDYDGFKNQHDELIKYLKYLEINSPKSDWTKNEKLAYWINIYNASTINLIIKNYPLKSIMDINSGKPWDLKFIKTGDKTYSLNQIENDIIRPTFKEPRIHFAVNCAAQSCPKLLNSAFSPSSLEIQLELATKKFINNKFKNTISAPSIKISQIFEWYAVDFGGDTKLVEYFNKYSTAKINSDATVTFQEYDWSLNN